MSAVRFVKGRRATAAVVVAAVLLLVGAGAALAAVGLNQVGSAQVKPESLTGLDIKNSTLFSSDIKDGGLLGLDLKPDTLTGREVNERMLGVPANISQEMEATTVANAAAGAALPEVLLFTRGDLALTAACWKQTDTNVLHGELFVRSSVNGSMLTSSLDSKGGGAAAANFLNIDTAKADRTIASPDTANNTFRLNQGGLTEFSAWAPGGDFMRGTLSTVLQNGTVAGVTAPLQAGTRCGFHGYFSAVAV